MRARGFRSGCRLRSKACRSPPAAITSSDCSATSSTASSRPPAATSTPTSPPRCSYRSRCCPSGGSCAASAASTFREIARTSFHNGGDAMSILYHDGNRQLQDRFDSRRNSDRLEEKLTRTAITADDKAYIEGAVNFFLATADAEGRPDCSFKGGVPGFVRVAGPSG